MFHLEEDVEDNEKGSEADSDYVHDVYHLPYTHVLRQFTWLSYIPCMPTYKERNVLTCCRRGKHKTSESRRAKTNQEHGDHNSGLLSDNVSPLECVTVT